MVDAIPKPIKDIWDAWNTITSLALEDNELWLRHLLGLAFQAIATVYVFLQSLPNDLWRPILLVSATGVIKYVERTLALYLANLDKFKDSMILRPDHGPNYAKLMEEYAAKKVMKMPTQIIKIEESEKDPKVGAKVKPDDLTELNILHKRFFSELKPDEALRILEVELNFIYEALYTKAEILHNWIGVIFRFIALGCLLAAIRIFQYKDKKDYGGFDVGLTYALLIGGIALDCIALIMFCLSDWTFVRLRKMKDEVDDPDTKLDNFLNWILGARGLKTEKYKCFKPSKDEDNKVNWFDKIIKPILIFMRLKKDEDVEKDRTDKTCHEVLDTFFMVRRRKFMDFFGIQAQFEEIIYTSSDRVTLDLWEHIFGEVLNKSRFADDSESTMRVSSARGDWSQRDIQGEDRETQKKRERLLRYVMEMDYDQSLLVWHIATELLYQSEPATEESHSDREFSKILSDYMMYLMMMQPTLMSAVVGIGKIRFRDTCEEAKRFFKRRHIESRDIKKASEAILSVTAPTKAEPIDVKGDKSKSVLFDGSMLAKELKGLKELPELKDGLKKAKGEAYMWEVVNKVWAELLCYAATKCGAIEHAAQLSKGGELISFVWLLMAHFGLGDQFQINQGDARAKLVIGK
ncbi:hypothetical protein YC2023_018912 [Brassica napus]